MRASEERHLPRLHPLIVKAKKMSILYSEFHSYFQWHSWDQKPKPLGSQPHTPSRTQMCNFSCLVFFSVFPFSKLLEMNCSFGDQILNLHFNSWPMEPSEDEERREREKKISFWCSRFFLPRKTSRVQGIGCRLYFQVLKHFLLKSFGSEVFKLHWGLFINTELCNKRKRTGGKSTFKVQGKRKHPLKCVTLEEQFSVCVGVWGD